MHDIEPNLPPAPTLRARLVRTVWSALPPLLFLAILAALILGLTVKIKDKKAVLDAEKASALAQERPAVNVVLQKIVGFPIRDRINLPGVIEAWTRLQLLAEISGVIMEVPVSEGNLLNKGDIIARIDPRDYRIALESARASYDLAASDLRRKVQLFDQGVISSFELENATAAAQTKKSVLDNAELQLERCTVRAPIDGVLNRLDAETGLLASIGDPLGEILQIDQVKAVIGIPESDMPTVRQIPEVEISLQALGGRTVSGARHFLANSPESFARLYRLELAVDNPGHAILPGMFCRAEIVKEEVSDSVVLPLYAVITRDHEKYVFVHQEGRAVKRHVRLGIQEGWRIQVTESAAGPNPAGQTCQNGLVGPSPPSVPGNSCSPDPRS